uniref:Uncharacterized protein n=1 Tax=Equus asinus asinus TaxID=83772 RepID=A0A8C4MZE6_EQUAS
MGKNWPWGMERGSGGPSRAPGLSGGVPEPATRGHSQRHRLGRGVCVGSGGLGLAGRCPSGTEGGGSLEEAVCGVSVLGILREERLLRVYIEGEEPSEEEGCADRKTLKNSKSLCSLDYEDEDEDDTRVKMAMSSPYDPHSLTRIVTLGSSPWALWKWEAAKGEGERGKDPSDQDSAREEGVFPLGCSELDLEPIEKN